MTQASYSVRLVKPFVEVLRDLGVVPTSMLRCVDELDHDARVSGSVVDIMLDAALRMTGDDQLGLKASVHADHGVVGVVDFLMSSSATVRGSLENACRYMRLLDGVAVWTLSVERERASVRLEEPLTIAAAAEDFCLCGLIRNQASSWPEGMLPDLEVWFAHPPPVDAKCYSDVVGPATFVFSAPRTGFSFPLRYLDQPLRTGNHHLQKVLRRAAEGALDALPRVTVDSMTERVRELAVEGLPRGNFGLDSAAERLLMSTRTLSRRLAEEQTTFQDVVDEVRKKVALDLVASNKLELSDVARRLGYRGVPSFYRAFRRWTGVTPGDYRCAEGAVVAWSADGGAPK